MNSLGFTAALFISTLEQVHQSTNQTHYIVLDWIRHMS